MISRIGIDGNLTLAELEEVFDLVKMDAGVAVIEMLKQEGVSHIFGIVGSSFLDILDPLFDRSDVKFIGTRHEQGAALMADGYSRISGKPSVCLVTNGPGVLTVSYTHLTLPTT